MVWEFQAPTPLGYPRSLSICSRGRYLLLYCGPSREIDIYSYNYVVPTDDDSGYRVFSIGEESLDLVGSLHHDEVSEYCEDTGFQTLYNLNYLPSFDRYRQEGHVVSFIQYVYVTSENDYHDISAKDESFFKTISYDTRTERIWSESGCRGGLDLEDYGGTRMYNFGGKVYFFDPRRILSVD